MPASSPLAKPAAAVATLFSLVLLGGLGGCAGLGPTPGGVVTGPAGTSLGPEAFSTVIIDAGHGGKDSGGTGHGLREKDLTLDTAQRVRAELERAGVHTVLTRSDDRFVELDDRVALANRYLGRQTILVSIHYNAVGGGGPGGAMTFFWHANSHGLATRIQRQVVSAEQVHDEGVIRRRIRLTRNPEIPCVLVECAYLTNAGEASRVAQPEFRAQAARGIAAGILEQRRLGDAGIPAVPELQAPLSRPTDRREF